MSNLVIAEQIAARFKNASQIESLRRGDPTERAAEMTEWMCSEGWARIVELVRQQEWGTLEQALLRLDSDELRCACQWAAIELARLEP
jgi:hypothetical protein